MELSGTSLPVATLNQHSTWTTQRGLITALASHSEVTSLRACAAEAPMRVSARRSALSR
jgi:hypothetical protein